MSGPSYLPDDPISRNAFTLSGPSPELEGLEPGSSQAAALRLRYFRFLFERRISVRNLPFAPDAPEAAPYLDDPRLTSFRIPPKRVNDAELIELLDRRGWLRKAYFRVIDEPKTARRYKQIQAYGELLRNAHPELRQLVCFNMAANTYAKNKTFWELAGRDVGIWCPVIIWFSNGAVRAEASRRAADGDEIWTYVCCDISPYANFLIDGHDTEPRILWWMMWKYRITGFQYWGVTAWKQGDPWQHPGNTPGHPNRYGDGVLLYPGHSVGVPGPVPSQRLENIRDGIEDYQYLHLLRDAGVPDGQIDAYVDRLVTDPKDYTRNPAALQAVRNQIGQRLDARARTADRL